MRRFLLCSGVAGKEEALQRLLLAVEEMRPEAVLFAGGVLNPSPHPTGTAEWHERHHADIAALDRFFQAIGKPGILTAVIPGPGDAPLQAFLHRGMHAETEFRGLNLVHGSLADTDAATIAGVGGALTPFEDSGDHVIRCSRTMARYLLRPFQTARKMPKILLLAEAPTGRLGGAEGSSIAAEFIDSYHPIVCVVGGATARRNAERVARTLIVNPGRLADKSAAWLDLGQEAGRQVEFLDI